MQIEKQGQYGNNTELKTVARGNPTIRWNGGRLELRVEGERDQEKDGCAYKYYVNLSLDELAALIKLALEKAAEAPHAAPRPW